MNKIKKQPLGTTNLPKIPTDWNKGPRRKNVCVGSQHLATTYLYRRIIATFHYSHHVLCDHRDWRVGVKVFCAKFLMCDLI